MSDSSPLPATLLSKHRLEALSDGVFAVVMTLLVLEIKPELEAPGGEEAVRHLLRHLILPVLTFAMAFFISGVFWQLHHRKFSLLRHTNPMHTGLTLCFLFTVTLLPISVSIFLHAKASGLAQAVYFGNFTLIALPLLLSWLYARRAGLADPADPTGMGAKLTRRIVTTTLMGLLATAGAYFHMRYVILLMLPVILHFRFQDRKTAAP